MTDSIALLTRLDDHAENDWLTRLRAQLPGETILPYRAMSAAERAGVDVAIVANPDPAQVSDLPNLKWIHSLWAGVERLVVELGPAAPPIARLIDPELARIMVEAVLAWTYYLQRDMPAYRRQQDEAVWRQLAYRHPAQVKLGVLGLGELGLAAANRLKQMGFAVSGWSRSPKAVDGIACRHGDDGLLALLGEADIVVCLLPLTPQTRGLLSARQLQAMKPGASLINFARGPIVVTEDLLQALDAGHLAHAVLDVFDVEPLPATSRLWTHPNVTVLPHISAPTNKESATAIVAANIRAYRLTGRLPPTVDLRKGY